MGKLKVKLLPVTLSGLAFGWRISIQEDTFWSFLSAPFPMVSTRHMLLIGLLAPSVALAVERAFAAVVVPYPGGNQAAGDDGFFLYLDQLMMPVEQVNEHRSMNFAIFHEAMLSGEESPLEVKAFFAPGSWSFKPVALSSSPSFGTAAVCHSFSFVLDPPPQGRLPADGDLIFPTGPPFELLRPS